MPKVNPEIMEWALAWNGISAEELATKSGYKSLPKWLSGEKEPTIKQLEKFATTTRTIVPYYFMDSVPDIRLQIPDFRTTAGAHPEMPSPELYDTVDDLLIRQAWMGDYFREEGYGPVELPRFDSNQVDVVEAANTLRDYLGLQLGWAQAGSYDEALRTLRRAIEARRISVSIVGYARNASRRTFDVNEFRGFVLYDDYAPMVFVNGRDAKVAQIFTLAHELAHLMFRDTGLINDPAEVLQEDLDAEQICDKIAAEFLAPTVEFIRLWDGADRDYAAVDRVRNYFKVSYVTCIRRALELGLIDTAAFWDFYNHHVAEMKELNELGEGLPKRNDGGNPYNTWGSKLGSVFTEAIFTAVKTGSLMYSEAYKLTGLKSATFDKYFARKGYSL